MKYIKKYEKIHSIYYNMKNEKIIEKCKKGRMMGDKTKPRYYNLKIQTLTTRPQLNL